MSTGRYSKRAYVLFFVIVMPVLLSLYNQIVMTVHITDALKRAFVEKAILNMTSAVESKNPTTLPDTTRRPLTVGLKDTNGSEKQHAESVEKMKTEKQESETRPEKLETTMKTETTAKQENETEEKTAVATGDFEFAERLKDRRSDFILYNGIPQSGTSSLRASMILLGVNVIDVAGPGWGCSASVTKHWEAAFLQSRTTAKEAVHNKTNHTEKTASFTLATGHACFPNLSARAVAVQTIREPVSRWRSAYEYGMWGKRKQSAKLSSRTNIINRLELGDAIQAESVKDWDPRLSFENCVLNVDCLANVILNEAMTERSAFLPCSDCKKPKIPSKSEMEGLVLKLTLLRSELLAMVDLMLREYFAIIPIQAQKTGLALLELAFPDRLATLSQHASLSRATEKRPAKAKSHNETAATAETVLSRIGDRGGFQTMYEIGAARFCDDVYQVGIKEANGFCQGFVDRSGASYASGTVSGTSNKFLLIENPMAGGLHNQLMALVSYAELAAKVNRTLVLPQLQTQFPHRDVAVIEFEDLYDVLEDSSQMGGRRLPSTQFPASVSLLRDVPAGAFLTRRIETLDLGSAKENFEDRFLEKVGSAAAAADEDLVIVKASVQPMTERGLVKCYDAFTPNTRMTTALAMLMRNHLTAEKEHGGRWKSIVTVHLRIERDWYKYSKKHCFGTYYIDFAQTQERFAAWVNATKAGNHSLKTIVLSFASGELPPNTPDLKIGWPDGFEVVTTDELLDKAGLKGMTYLERSILLGRVALHSQVFVGNWYSSFSRQLILSRNGKDGISGADARKSLIYNTVELEDMTGKLLPSHIPAC